MLRGFSRREFKDTPVPKGSLEDRTRQEKAAALSELASAMPGTRAGRLNGKNGIRPIRSSS
jgi:hypothetical protein